MFKHQTALLATLAFLFLAPLTVLAQLGDFTFFEPAELLIPPPPVVKPVRPGNLTIESEFFSIVNETRVEHGLKPLQWSDEIAAIAREHSTNMAVQNFFGHLDRSGRSIDDRADAHGLKKWRMIGENLAYCNGYANPVETTLEAWLESEGHRKNLLRKKWRETGIGVAVAPSGRIYVTQVFLKRK